MAKRIRGEGSIFFDEGKRLWTLVKTYDLPNGEKKQKRITGKTERALKTNIAKFEAQIEQAKVYTQNVSLEKWLSKWLDTYVKPPVRKQKTYENYRDRLNYLIPIIGARKINTITTMELQEIFNALHMSGGKRGGGLAAHSVNRIRSYLKTALNSAIEHGLLAKNPVNATKRLAEKKAEIVVMNEQEVRKFLAIAKDGSYITFGVKNPKYIKNNFGTQYLQKNYYNFVNLALATGMRCGELRGLSWNCVDFAAGNIKVEEQLVTTNDYADMYDDPKTYHSTRTIGIDKAVLNELREFKDYQNQYAELLGDRFLNEHDLIFTNTFGKPVCYSNFRKRYFVKMIGAAGISSKITIHCMRHTHATLLLKAGVNISVVSKRLGHSSTTVTLNIYAHVLEEMEKTAEDAWGKLLDTDE